MTQKNRSQKQKNYTNETKNKLAHLALLVNKEENQADTCPTSEDLAVFIEQQGQASSVLAHIAQCEPCYEEWITLSEEYQSTHGVLSKTYKVIKSQRYLKAIGSTLAIAASVMLFLIVPQDHIEEANIQTDHLAKEMNDRETHTVTSPPLLSTEPQVGGTAMEGLKLDEKKSDQVIATKQKKATPHSPSRTQKTEATSSYVQVQKRQLQTDLLTDISAQLDDFCANKDSAPSVDELILLLERAGTYQLTTIQEERLDKLLILLNDSNTYEKEALCESIEEILKRK